MITHRWSGLLTPIWLGMRYVMSRSNRYSFFVNFSSVAGIALGVMLLVAVASIMNGLGSKQRLETLAVLPHGFIPFTEATPEAMHALKTTKDVAEIGKFFQGKGLLSKAGRVYPVEIHGIDGDVPQGLSRHLPGITEASSLSSGGIALPLSVVDSLSIVPGESVGLIVPISQGGQLLTVPVTFRLEQVFLPGTQAASALAIVNFQDLEERGLTRGGETGWRIWLHRPLRADSALGHIQGVRLWSEDYGMLFAVWRLEKTLLLLILLLVLVLGAFNIASGQVMLINDKLSDLAILATMGAEKSFLVTVLVTHGTVISIVGVGSGIAVGCLIATFAGEVVSVLEALAGRRLLEGTYFTAIPSEIYWSDLVVIVMVAAITCGLASLRPALFALRLQVTSMLHQ